MVDLPAEANRPIRPLIITSRINILGTIFSFPWWLLILGVAAVSIANLISTNEMYRTIFRSLAPGLEMTLRVAFTAYGTALVIGLLVGIVRANPPKPVHTLSGNVFALLRLAVYQFCNLYVQILRGLPTLVTLLIVAFVLVPQFNNAVLRPLGVETIKGASAPSAIIALAFTYGAFLSETFRAGIQSIEKGQIEAARALGMSPYLILRYIVLPQALRRILPPLGNDFIAMIKDSSLVAILGVEDITQLAKLSSSASFRYMETYMVAAILYLSMTIIGSLVVRYIEQRFAKFEQR